MPRLAALILLWGFLMASLPVSAEALNLTQDSRSVALGPSVSVYEDPGGALTLAEVQQRGGEFRASGAAAGTVINFGYSSSAWWLRIDLRTDEQAPRDWLLEVAFPTLDSIEYFGPDGTRLSVGDRQRFGARSIRHRNFVFPVHLPESRAGSVWLRIASEGTLTVPLTLWRPDAFWQASLGSYALLALYFGMLLALALYNFLLWISLRDRNYLLYVMFVCSMGVGQLSLNGFGNQFLWPEFPAWGNLAFSTGFAATGFFGALFTRAFLETRRNLPRFDGAIVGLAALFALCALAPLAAPYRLAAIMTSLTGVVFALVAVIAGLRSWRARQPGAVIFLVAWTALLAGVVVVGMRNLDLLPTTFLSFYAIQIGSALEMVLLSFALAERIRVLQREKDAAEGEAMSTRQELVAALRHNEVDLERRVTQRTSELEGLNARLRESERQLQAMVHTDPLTGLANRLLLEARLEQSMQQARRNNGQIALLLIDLDRFKEVNDTRGHAIGDEVLRTTAERLRSAVREVDTVARIGGDEFVVVLSAIGSAADAERLAAKLVDGIRQPMRVLAMPIECGASVGVALFAGGSLTSTELLRRADRAMYAAKEAGRNCYRVFSG